MLITTVQGGVYIIGFNKGVNTKVLFCFYIITRTKE